MATSSFTHTFLSRNVIDTYNRVTKEHAGHPSLPAAQRSLKLAHDSIDHSYNHHINGRPDQAVRHMDVAMHHLKVAGQVMKSFPEPTSDSPYLSPPARVNTDVATQTAADYINKNTPQGS
jgi:hypothetical protein